MSARSQPGKTREADILRVPLLEEAEVAKKLGLPCGVGINDRFLKFIKPILTVFCWITAALSLGLGFELLNPKNLFGNAAGVILSLVMGGMVALGILLFLGWLWKIVGNKVGSCRPTKEVLGVLIPSVVVTTAILMGLAVLDANALILLNAARAALNPAFAIPTHIAILIGLVLSGIYVLGVSAASFADGYSATAKQTIEAVINTDEKQKQEAAKARMPVQLALGALANVKVADEIAQAHEDELKRADEAFKAERAELLASLPELPTNLEPEEIKESNELRDRARSADTHLNAHLAARRVGANGADNTGANGVTN